MAVPLGSLDLTGNVGGGGVGPTASPGPDGIQRPVPGVVRYPKPPDPTAPELSLGQEAQYTPAWLSGGFSTPMSFLGSAAQRDPTAQLLAYLEQYRLQMLRMYAQQLYGR